MPQTVREQKKNSREAAPELLRIIGALMVIGTHLKQGYFTGNGSLIYSRVMIACFVAEGVAIFWLICGFYFPGNVDSKLSYREIMKKAVRRILIPVLGLSVFTFFFAGFLVDGKTLAESIHHSPDVYRKLIKSLFQWKNAVSDCFHLWYMYVYFLVMLCFPLPWGLVCWARSRSKSYYALYFLWAALLINDAFHNSIFNFSHYSINGMAGALVYIFTGSILYQWRNEFAGNKRWCLAGILMFLGANLLRFHFTCEHLLADPKDILMLYWYTNFGFISSIGIVLTVWGIIPWIQKNEPLKKLICHLGSRTMGIYLIHYLVLKKTWNMGLNRKLNAVFGGTAAGSVLYQLVYMLIIFLLSLIIVEVYYYVRSWADSVRPGDQC